MARRFSIASLVLTMIAFNVALLLALASPSVAADKPGKDARGAQSGAKDRDGHADPGSSRFTEDDDTNDGNIPNNVPDDGDNAHPSGKDRSVERRSGTQGKSESSPDDSKGPMRYEKDHIGADKANGPGGSDLADQDGNNGCGNDDDFDDDNNGWCGKRLMDEPETPEEPEEPCVDDLATPEDECNPSETPDDDDDGVLSGKIDRPGGDEVRGTRIDPASARPDALDRPSVRGSRLPFTGAGITSLVAAAGVLMVAGAALLKRRARTAGR